MKILVMSDSHDELQHMICAVEEVHPDHIFFLGDHERDAWDLNRVYPNIPICAVRGNCDWSGGQDLWVVELQGIRFLLVHGHQQGAKTGLDRLAGKGLMAGARVVCFGHTHRVLDQDHACGVRLFNPGTIGGPHGQRTTYGIIYAENGNFKTEIKELI